MNGMNKKTPEPHECKSQLRVQKQREQSRARLACETKERAKASTPLTVKRLNVVSEVILVTKTGQETQKRLKARRQRDVSRRRCQTAELTRDRRLLGLKRTKWILAAVSMKEHQRRNQRVLTLPATSSSETMREKTSKAWTWDPCSQTLSGFNIWRYFLSCWNNPFGSRAKRQYPISRFNIITAIQLAWTILLKYVLCYLC